MKSLQQTAEEIVNSLTHGVGLALSAAGGAVLLTGAALRGEAPHLASCAVYVATLLFLYTASTLYHWAVQPRIKHILRILDHIGILFLIAGTYTPFCLILMRGERGWLVFGAVWGLALAGALYKVFSTRRFRNSFTLFYLATGWVGAFLGAPALLSIPAGALAYIAAGGVCYTVGVIFYLWDSLPYAHSVWHGFVVAGSVLHYLAILFYVLP